MKMEKFKTIESHSYGEIEVKRSKFIANMFQVENEEQAKTIVKEIRKKYFDAKHNCYAYKIAENSGVVERSNDDGEPSGTAGMPILNIINSEKLCNIIIIVTRYFGGTLLGTGGLIRSYTDACKEALNNAKIVEKTEGYEINIILEYSNLELFEYYARNNNIKITNKIYDENVQVHIEISKSRIADLTKFFNNLSNNNGFEILKEGFIEVVTI